MNNSVSFYSGGPIPVLFECPDDGLSFNVEGYQKFSSSFFLPSSQVTPRFPSSSPALPECIRLFSDDWHVGPSFIVSGLCFAAPPMERLIWLLSSVVLLCGGPHSWPPGTLRRASLRLVASER